jgi:hypothetical protein
VCANAIEVSQAFGEPFDERFDVHLLDHSVISSAVRASTEDGPRGNTMARCALSFQLLADEALQSKLDASSKLGSGVMAPASPCCTMQVIPSAH